MNAIFVGASWCASCKPAWEAVQKEALKLGVVVEYADAESLEERFSVRGVPCLILDDEVFSGSSYALIQHLRTWAKNKLPPLNIGRLS